MVPLRAVEPFGERRKGARRYRLSTSTLCVPTKNGKGRVAARLMYRGRHPSVHAILLSPDVGTRSCSSFATAAQVGHHAVWDTMLVVSIPCRVGYPTVWDTMLTIRGMKHDHFACRMLREGFHPRGGCAGVGAGHPVLALRALARISSLPPSRAGVPCVRGLFAFLACIVHLCMPKIVTTWLRPMSGDPPGNVQFPAQRLLQLLRLHRPHVRLIAGPHFRPFLCGLFARFCMIPCVLFPQLAS